MSPYFYSLDMLIVVDPLEREFKQAKLQLLKHELANEENQ
jgi:hypothetical protein